MQKIIILAVFLALAFAQSPQTGQLTPYTLTSGVPVTGTLLPTTEAANYHVDLYQLWVPENATAVNVTFTNSNSNCYYLNLYVRTSNTGGLPCSRDDYDYDHESCAMDYSIDSGIGGYYTTLLAPGDQENLYEWQVDGWMYFGVGRYGSYNTEACTYTFSAAINGSCPTGTLSIGDEYQAMCSGPYITVNSNPYMANISSSTVFMQFYKLDLPLDVGHIHVRLNVSDTGFDIYGKNYGAPVSGDYDCYDSGYNYQDNSSMYIYDLYCYTPRVGDFYLYLENQDYAFNGTIEIDYLVCPFGYGGYNCTYQSVPFNGSYPQTFNVPEAGGLTSDGFAYVYVDIPANYTGGDITVVAVTGQSGYLYIRYGGYPEDSSTFGYLTSDQYNSISSGYPDSFTLNNFDYYMPGRWYFGLECYSSSTNFCNITVSRNNSGPVTTGSTTAAAASTTGSTTGSTTHYQTTTGSTTYYQTTTGSTTARVTTSRLTTSRATTARATTAAAAGSSSSASVIVPSFVAAFFAILALF